MPAISIHQASLQEILPLRSLFLQENNIQIRYDACHVRNWSDSYLIEVDGEKTGYGSVKGLDQLSDRDSIFEYYILPGLRKKAREYFLSLIQTTQVQFLECQTNEPLMSAMMFEFGRDIHSEVMLFEDHLQTHLPQPDVHFRLRTAGEDVFGKKEKDAGQYVLEKNGVIVADGGFLTHYNEPFADLYMEVSPQYQRQGLGAFILQEVKKECYRAGRVPAARCNISNLASRSTLLKAGMRNCGFMLIGKIKT